VDCHGPEKTTAGGPRAGRLLLDGGRGPMFSHSYYMLTVAGLFADGRNRAQSNYGPRQLGSGASKLFQYIDGTHYGAKASPAQEKLLRLWIDSGAAYPGTYAALGTGMIGGYAENQQVDTDWHWEQTKAAGEVLGRRCAACHETPARLLPRSLSDERGVSFWQPDMRDPRLNTSRHIVFDLTHPEKSMLLLAPLAESAGGWGACADPAAGGKKEVFANRQDPDYLKLLALCQAGHDHLQAIKRFDMPGFKPRVDWVREMVRYGTLPPGTTPDTSGDYYLVEQAYWKSLWHRPQ
jgi:hypothetical protein